MNKFDPIWTSLIQFEPKPSTSREDCQIKERHPVRNTGSAGSTRRVTIAPPPNAREVVIVTSEDDQYESSEDNSHEDPENDDLDRIAYCRPSEEQINGDKADELDQDSDDGDETTLVISSPSETDFDDEFTEDA